VAGDSMIALRLGTTAAVVASAMLLRAIGARLLPGVPWLGTVAGLIYIAASLHNGGEGTNAELLLAPFALGGMALALAALENRRLAHGAAAGALFGVAVLVKPVALADGAATALMLVALPAIRGHALGQGHGWVRIARLYAAIAAGAALPLLAMAGWYAAIGASGLLVETLAAAGDAGLVRFNAEGLAAGTRPYAPLLGGFALGLAAVATEKRRRMAAAGGIAIACWLAMVAAMLALLGRFADHMFIQLLPPLALGTAAFLVLAARALPLTKRSPHALRLGALGLALLVVLAWGAGRFAHAGLETLWQREAAGVRHWGDRTATIAAALRSRIEGPGDLLVIGRLLGLYHATGTRPPTRYPFSLHLWAGYAPVDGVAEIARITATPPRFVVVDALWLPGGPRTSIMQAQVLDRLAEVLARDYLHDGQTGRFISWRGGFVGGGVGATVFRRRDVPPFDRAARPQSIGGLQYDPVPAAARPGA